MYVSSLLSSWDQPRGEVSAVGAQPGGGLRCHVVSWCGCSAFTLTKHTCWGFDFAVCLVLYPQGAGCPASYFFLLFGSWRQKFFLFLWFSWNSFLWFCLKIFNFQVNFEDFIKFSWFWIFQNFFFFFLIFRKSPYFWFLKYLSYVQLLRL